MALAPSLKALLERPAEARRIGPFHLLQQLGSGSFAPVWLAREVYGDVEIRRAAVKLFTFDGLLPGAPGGSETRLRRDRVLEEARLLGQVEHPNIVRLYRLLPDEVPGIVGIAMEYADGASLEHRLNARGGKLPLDEVLSIGAAVASALSAVHRAGLVHRDIKPANVVEASGVIKLIDFGIASTGARQQRPPERSGPRPMRVGELPPEVMGLPPEVMGENMSMLGRLSARPGGTALPGSEDVFPSGTVGYIDPVCVAEGVQATPASDLYALGATLFECITGSCPSVVAAGPGRGMKDEVLNGHAPAPRLLEVAPGVPVAFAQLIDALLSAKREDRPASTERVAIALERLRTERAGRTQALPPESVGPFRGLGRFEKDDRDVYFGRSAETAAALQMLRSRGLVALVGASGSGKSSLARAGVGPLVADGGLGGWIKTYDLRVVMPGENPRASIVAALADLLPEVEALAPDAIVSALAARAEAEGRGTLLVLDQLEELVTVAAGPPVAWTAELLTKIADPMVPGVRALVAARRDLLDPLLALGGLGRVLPRGMLLITPMSEAAWGEVIEQAIEAYGYTLEDGPLREKLMAELAATASAMPLVQFALTELWEQRDRVSKKITWAGLQAIGGLTGALEKHADVTLQSLTSAERAAVRGMLLSMTTPQGTRATRTEEELERNASAPEVKRIVAQLEAARLVVREKAGLTLAHEALLTQWGTLREWLAPAQLDRLLAQDLERDAALWAQEARDAVLLWKKRRLALAEEVTRRGLVELSAEAKAFVQAGRSAARRRGVLVGAAVAAVVVIGVLAGGKYVEELNAMNVAIKRALKVMMDSEQRAMDGERRAIEQKVVAEQALRAADEARTTADGLRKSYQDDLEKLQADVRKAKTKQEFEELQRRLKEKSEETSRQVGERPSKDSRLPVMDDPFEP